MRPRWRKVLNDIWAFRTRSLLVIASIATGLFALGTIVTIRFIVREDMRSGYAAVNPANIRVEASPFDQRMVDRIGRLPGVHLAEGAREFALRLETAPGEWTTINIRALPDWNKQQLNRLSRVAGSWPPGEREIAIERYRLPDTNAQIGDLVTLEVAGGKTRHLKLSGVVSEQTLGSYETGASFFLAPVQGYISQDTLDWLGQTRSEYFNTLYVSVEQNGEDPAYLLEFAEFLSNELEKGGVSTISFAVRGSYDHPNRVFTDAISSLLVILGFLVVFLSGFLITNTLQALVAQQVVQIGIMKTVGARQGQIVAIYMALILVFSLASIAIAIPTAFETAFRANAWLGAKINIVYQGKRIFPAAIILQVAVGLIVPQFAAFFPIWRGAKLSIQEALSGLRQDHLLYQDWLSRQIGRLGRFTRPTLVALRNTVRRKGRLLLTLITLALGGAVFIGTFNVRNSMSEFIVQVSRYFLGDINLTLSRSYRIEEVAQVLSSIPEIDYFEAWGGARTEMYQAGGVIGESIQMVAPPAASRLVTPVMLLGRWIEPGDQNAVVFNETFLTAYPDIQVGDTIRLRVNGRGTEWKVVGFYRLAGQNTGLVAYTSFEYLSALTGTPGQASLYRIVAKKKNLTESEQRLLGRDVEILLEKAGIETNAVSAGNWVSTTASEGFNVLTGFLLFLALLTALVGSIGLTGTMSMNVFERTREIGIMRAIGASNPALMRMILTEGLVIGLLSWIISAFLALPISLMLYNVVSTAIFGVESELSPTPLGYLTWLLVVVLLSLLASFLPARNAAHLTIREVLAYE